MNRKKIDIQSLIEKGDYIIVNLTDFDEPDFKGFAAMFRPIWAVRKDAIHVPMFEAERETCSDKVWTALSSLSKKGTFANSGAKNYSDLLSNLGKNGNAVFVVVKNPQSREEIVRANVSRVKTIFCDLDPDGQLYLSKIASKKTTSQVTRDNKQDMPRDCNENTSIVQTSPVQKPAPIPPKNEYTIASTPTIRGIQKLTSSISISEGTILYDSSRNVYRMVRKELRNNGAYTYSTSQDGVWAKIYDDSYNSSFFENKVRRMLKNPVAVHGIIWPKDVLTDANGVFRGFLMDSFSGQPLQTSVFKRDGQLQYFPNWEKTDICTLTLTILKKIQELHSRGILLGCINPAAIRVVSPETVFFCDTDDYQIEGYPTLSNNISFAAPENLGKRLYLATQDSENFSVAELVFMLLMMGKTPYLSGTSNVIETIQRMRFPFYKNDFDERNPSLHIMPSMWRFMWSHLSLETKNAFCCTFQKNLPYNPPGKRLSVLKWYNLVERYRNELLCAPSSDSNSLYPSTFKKKEGETFYRCSICGKEHPKFFFDPDYFEEYRVCNVCMERPSDKSYTCVDCGRTFIYKNRTALFHQRMRETNDDWKHQKHCPECKAKKETCSHCGKRVPYYELNDGMCKTCRENTVYETRSCKECGQRFSITYAQKKYFDSKGFDYPKKCEQCRKNKNSGGNNSNTKRRGFLGRIFGF